MATEPFRAYRAACPNCGAPVAFASAASVSAVCSFCRSTLVRDGEALRRIGVSAELFDDHSPLQLGVAGRLAGEAFTLIGRLQYGYADGTWNEWHALFDNGKSGWLSEDNGAYVFAFDAAAPADAPRPELLSAGESRRIGERDWDVASVQRAKLIAAQGELPAPPRLDEEFTVADLRNVQGEVATIDGSDAVAIHWSVGRSVLLSALALQGLREAAEKTLASRSIQCPSCGTAIEAKLSTTQSLACPQCKAVVDLSQGVGAELAHYAQNREGGLQPQIPLGSLGTFAFAGTEARWQLVGYVERCDLPEPGDDEEEQTFWREYLLHEPQQGFAFIVDAEDGWSWVKPITGTPGGKGEQVVWNGVPYEKKYGYFAKVTWVEGEFYWRLRRDERARVDDYHSVTHSGQKRLSREETSKDGGQEVTWSAGETLSSATVADAFGLTPAQRAALQRDVAPLSGSAGRQGLSWKAVVAFIVVVMVISVLSDCSSDDCDDARSAFGAESNEYRQCQSNRGSGGARTSGGSFGGYSSGGSHK